MCTISAISCIALNSGLEVGTIAELKPSLQNYFPGYIGALTGLH